MIRLPVLEICRKFIGGSENTRADEADRQKIVHWMHYLEMASQFMANPLRTFLGEPLFPLRFKKVVEEMFAYGASVMANISSTTFLKRSGKSGSPRKVLSGLAMNWLAISR